MMNKNFFEWRTPRSAISNLSMAKSTYTRPVKVTAKRSRHYQPHQRPNSKCVEASLDFDSVEIAQTSLPMVFFGGRWCPRRVQLCFAERLAEFGRITIAVISQSTRISLFFDRKSLISNQSCLSLAFFFHCRYQFSPVRTATLDCRQAGTPLPSLKV